LSRLCSELGRQFNGDAFQKVIYIDSHDSAANGSARLNEVAAPRQADGLFARQQSLIAATVLFTAPGVPMLLQGQEFMEGGAFNDWQALNWDKATAHAGIVEAYKHLIALGKDIHGVTAGLRGQNFNLMHVDENNKVMAYHRWKAGGPKDDVVVVINFSKHLHQEYVLSLPRDGIWTARFNSTWEGYASDFKNIIVPDVTVSEGSGTLVLPPSSAIILSQNE